MSEEWLRLGLVAGTVAIALAAILAVRARERRRPMDAGPTDLGPGLYLFSSGACLDCRPARRIIEESLGPGGFTEIRWEDSPETFRDLGIEAVPATVVVSGSGLATVYPGMPHFALKAFNP